MDTHRIDFGSLPWETPAPGVRSKAHDRDGKRLRLVEFTRDFFESDWCRKGHMGYVLDGVLEIDFSGTIVVFGAGDGIFIPSTEDDKHKARVLSDVVRLVLVEEL
jgi:hypothetical protein